MSLRSTLKMLSPRRQRNLLGMLAMVLVAGGCATPPREVAMADPSPPRLVQDDKGEIIWDNPYAFQPIPRALRPAGNKACRAADAGIAAGYHPYARDLQGQQIAGGGYFCISRAEIWPIRTTAASQTSAADNPTSVPAASPRVP